MSGGETPAGTGPAADLPPMLLDFSEALRFLRHGIPVLRQGWNGKGMWLGYCPGSRLQIHGGAAAEWTEARSEPFIVMRTADGKYVPWLASQTDLLALDWTFLRPGDWRKDFPASEAAKPWHERDSGYSGDFRDADEN